MVKVTTEVFRISNGIKLCDLYVNLTDIDYDKAAECAVPAVLDFLSKDEKFGALFRVLLKMGDKTVNALTNALFAFTPTDKDELFTAAAVSFGDMANDAVRAQDLSLNAIHSYVVGRTGMYNLTLDFFAVQSHAKICTANVIISAETMTDINEYIMSRFSEKPSLLLKVGVGVANNSFVLGKLLKLYLPTLNEIFAKFGVSADNLTIA